MTCTRYETDLALYVERDLPEADVAAVEAHLWRVSRVPVVPRRAAGKPGAGERPGRGGDRLRGAGRDARADHRRLRRAPGDRAVPDGCRPGRRPQSSSWPSGLWSGSSPSSLGSILRGASPSRRRRPSHRPRSRRRSSRRRPAGQRFRVRRPYLLTWNVLTCSACRADRPPVVPRAESRRRGPARARAVVAIARVQRGGRGSGRHRAVAGAIDAPRHRGPRRCHLLAA